MTDPTLPLAFAAGVVSFLSPCVLPIVPGYLSYMSGMTGADDPEARKLPAWAVAITFVIGFSLVFIALGATATLLGSLLRENQRLLARAGGAVIIVLGLIFMGALYVLAIAIYVGSRLYRKRQGMDLKMVYGEIPAE